MGYALARYLDELGFTVFAGFQNIDENPYASDLKEESSGRLHILQLDVSSETQILAASLYIVEHLPDDASGLWAVIHAANYFALGEIEWIPYEVGIYRYMRCIISDYTETVNCSNIKLIIQ